jgi:signal transduction histidine kinase
MGLDQSSDLGERFADRLGRDHEAIARRWMRQVTETPATSPHALLSKDCVVGEVSDLLWWVAAHVRDGDPLRAERIERMRALIGAARERGYPAHEFLSCLHRLGGVLFAVLTDEVIDTPEQVPNAEVAALAARLNHTLSLLARIAAGLWADLDREERERRRLNEAERIEEFVRSISHELKNPLGAAENGLQMLREEEIARSPAERERFLELALRNLRRAFDLLADLRARALASSPDRAVSPREWVPIQRVLQQVRLEVGPAAKARGVRIEMPELGDTVRIDGSAGALILMNLVWNAVKYSDPQKPQQWVRVRVVSDGSAPGLRIEVADNGLGIPAEAADRVFERFFRAHPEVEDGTGLGLSIAHDAVRQLGGRIWLETTAGVGTTFFVLLPRTEDSSVGRSDSVSPNGAGNESDTSKRAR